MASLSPVAGQLCVLTPSLELLFVLAAGGLQVFAVVAGDTVAPPCDVTVATQLPWHTRHGGDEQCSIHEPGHEPVE